MREESWLIKINHLIESIVLFEWAERRVLSETKSWRVTTFFWENVICKLDNDLKNEILKRNENMKNSKMLLIVLNHFSNAKSIFLFLAFRKWSNSIKTNAKNKKRKFEFWTFRDWQEQFLFSFTTLSMRWLIFLC